MGDSDAILGTPASYGIENTFVAIATRVHDVAIYSVVSPGGCF
jgi:hypothetical protein